MGYARTILRRLGLSNAQIDTFYPMRTMKLRGWLYRFRLGRCGWGTTIDRYVTVLGGKSVQVGEYSAINAYTHIWGHNGVRIGNRVMIASHTAITSLTHDYTRPDMRFAPAIGGPIVIEDDVWIGSHVVIVPGVTIGRGAVVGAGAVVRDDVPPFAIVAGVPARIVRYRPESAYPISNHPYETPATT
ncbi:acyltransferase [Spirosoma rhododendri]|uniref:Acyltransferase n=1 Tax=Spirosoma rhododendri TaxID=2728024 RepID=A0A7L5DGX1_9BACT|nr:acyltransferase [Spirosoma rhododendri]QJD77225.1 acyltransferase [Spirosoma rhododendri]